MLRVTFTADALGPFRPPSRGRSARRIEEKERDGMTERDGNGGGRESEERIERERMRGRGTKIVKRRRARKRETIGDVYRRHTSVRQTSTRGSVAAAGLGVNLSRRS